MIWSKRAVAAIRRIVLVVLAAGWLAGLAPQPAVAAGNGSADRVLLTALGATVVDPNAVAGPVRFVANVSYDLTSAPQAFLLLLVFEDSAKTASQSVANAHWVASGASQAELTLTYQPKPTTKTVVVFAGLFDPNKNLLAFSSTQPFPAEPAPGRALFDRAMQERQAGRHAAAVQDLTSAIALAPNNGNYYYWRADNLVQFGQYDRAIADYDRALTFVPGNRATRVGRAIARMWKGEWNLAIDELTRVIDERPAPDRWTVWALRARGIAHAEVGQYAAAIADYYRYLSLTSSAADKATVENWISQLGP